jgi:hypothetical protein
MSLGERPKVWWGSRFVAALDDGLGRARLACWVKYTEGIEVRVGKGLYGAGLQPSDLLGGCTWGFAPCWYRAHLWCLKRWRERG